MKTASYAGLLKALRLAAVCLALGAASVSSTAYGLEQGRLVVSKEDGYARLVLTFPGRQDLPKYTTRLENGVLSVQFDEAVSVVMPDVGAALPDYVSAARIDPDGRGLRIGLRRPLNFNRIDAGEKLFIDLMPDNWQGPLPTLPQDVIDDLAQRGLVTAIDNERKRKADTVASLNPQAIVRIGRNPTFMRIQFDWSIPTTGEFLQDENTGVIGFEWPVGVDMRDLTVDLPPEIASVETGVTPDGATVKLLFAKGIKPRFYHNSSSQYVLDIDIAGVSLPSFNAASLADSIAVEGPGKAAAASETATKSTPLDPKTVGATIRPFVSVLGSTVRVVFPFEQDTPAAVFRRGNTVWMMFDTISAGGDTQVVRITLTQERLATLGSEGMSWVLSLGDMMLTPTEPIALTRRRDVEGAFQMVADVARPARIHEFTDPEVGDVLKIVTAYPPARGIARTLDYVDFSALRSIHGLVVKPRTSDLSVALEDTIAVISEPGGLTVSAIDTPRSLANSVNDTARVSYVNLGELEEPNAALFLARRAQLMETAASSEGKQRETARLNLAQYFIANRFGPEALGVLKVLAADLKTPDLARKLRMATAIADTITARPGDALAILNTPALGQDIDALFWRTMARADAADFRGARLDALDAGAVAPSYPMWARNRFYFAGIRAAVETGDNGMATRFLEQIDFATLSIEDTTLYNLMSGRIEEERGNTAEAIDTYGQVIVADVRPTRAEAVYRTLLLLDKDGKLDVGKATDTLAAEALLWRGSPLEAEMLKLLADLYFREGSYRQGFEVVKQAVSNYADSPAINGLQDKAQAMFGELYLNGRADALGPVEALSLYYDFRQLTPPGARGDQMIRNLATRLVRVDLLPQAAQLLEYQLNERLRGVAKTQVATDLAVIYLADRKPQDAMRVLNATRVPGLSDGLARQRRILEARAMVDGGRDQLALDLLRDVTGRDADLLRIDAHWKARRYTQAGEMIENLYEGAGAQAALSQPARMNVIKAAVGYVLASDTMGLARLRNKFSDRLVTSPEWPMFDYVTGTIEISSLEFKQVATQVSAIDSLNAFLSSYRETYSGQGALTPTEASVAGAGLASAR